MKKQSIEEQLDIMKAYSEGKPVYRIDDIDDIGKQVEPKDHQFNFANFFYSLSPLDWCTGKSATDAYELFIRNGSEKDPPPAAYNVTCTREDETTKKKFQYTRRAMDTVGTYVFFVAGAEWALKNKDNGIDFSKSLDSLRGKYKRMMEDMDADKRSALGG